MRFLRYIGSQLFSATGRAIIISRCLAAVLVYQSYVVAGSIATSWLTGCATAGFEAGGVAACLPVVEYSREFQVRAVEELAILPDGSAVVEMMGDYAVMRGQARACAGQFHSWSEKG